MKYLELAACPHCYGPLAIREEPARVECMRDAGHHTRRIHPVNEVQPTQAERGAYIEATTCRECGE